MNKIVSVYIVYGIDAFPRNCTYNFKFKKCLFGATSMVKSSDKKKYAYGGYGMTFDGVGSWSFDNNFARKVIIFGVESSSSSHSDNRKDNFLILDEGPTYGINGNFGLPEQKFCINFTKGKTRFCLSSHYNTDFKLLTIYG